MRRTLALMAATAIAAGIGMAGMVPAVAAPMIFFGEDQGTGGSRVAFPNSLAAEADFLSHLSGVGTEDFEGFAAGANTPLNLSFPGSSGGITATLNGGGSVNTVPSGTFAGRYPTSGDQYWESGDNFSINFSEAISAFGFFGIDIGDFAGDVTVTLSNGALQVFNIEPQFSESGGVLFWGIIDPDAAHAFTSVTFGNTQAGTDFFGFDDMTIGDVEQIRDVPEPGMLPLIGLGLLGLGLTAQRRRRAA